MRVEEEAAKKWHEKWVESDDCHLVGEELESREYGDEYVAAFVAGIRWALEKA